MKIKKVKVWQCPTCDEIHDVMYEPIPAVQDGYECGECGSLYLDREEAKECCRE